MKQNVLTPEVMADGLGGVRDARLEASIEEMATSFGLPAKPKASDVFDASYLPAAHDRAVAR